ncbi:MULTISPECIES: hypothetical protein [unclassified Acinetobacter]|uniref:hypothetical protein n=1 Tax=unclassified Acinetobacter TaxID=196816 RepID=UPI0025757DDC|nr:MULTISPECIES: hypothetical protein [unclassified Acinetobacter]MDM1765709.1 hypothetical protein [Acinetobacter sp. 226-1]MDM1769404.1 hypothetical protein [Acinetobacter sp. 226-4]
MSETTTAVAETSAAIAGKVTTVTGTGVTLVSWAAALDWGFLIGVGIGLAGLIISFMNFLSNRQFQKRKDKREQELHEIEMCEAKYKQRMKNSKSELKHEINQ